MSELNINTTQNVNISFITATIGERILASILDSVFAFIYIIGVTIIINYTPLEALMNNSDFWTTFSIATILYSPAVFYTLILESFLEGQTLGKKILKIKVIKIDGYQASFFDYFMRWVCRVIDINALMGIIGIVSIAISKNSQRIGDMAAGTAVVSLKNDVGINSTILENLEDNYIPKYSQVIKLTDNDVRIIKNTFNTSRKIQDPVLLNQLKQKIEMVTGIKSTEESDYQFIDKILKDYNYYTQTM